MTQNRLTALIFSALWLCGATPADADPPNSPLIEYNGADAGRLVISIGAYQGAEYSEYALDLRTKDRSKKTSIGYSCSTYTCGNPLGFLSKQESDYSNSLEAGDVTVLSLQPGDYEFFNFAIIFNNGMRHNIFTSKDDFSIPFTIKPGQTMYLGEFRAMVQYGQNFFGMPLPAGVIFQVSDQSARDIPIARRKNSAVEDPTIAIPDIRAINNPAFVALPQ